MDMNVHERTIHTLILAAAVTGLASRFGNEIGYDKHYDQDRLADDALKIADAVILTVRWAEEAALEEASP